MARADVFRLLLIRSGSTDWDEQNHLAGAADHPLCETGRASFGVGHDATGEVDLRCVLCGEDQASEESARLFAGTVGAKVRVYPELGEADLGLWQGLRMDQIKERSPRIYKQWCDDPLSLSPPEGEPLREAQDRLLSALARGMERAAKNSKSATPAIAAVLRPVAFGLVRARLIGDSSIACWSKLCDGPEYEWHSITADRLATLRATTVGAA